MCQDYSCNTSCTATDPYTISFSFQNLTLSPGYPAPSSLPGDQSDDSSIPAANTLSGEEWFQPATYYVTVEGVAASGRGVISTSNGVTMDTTPPVLTSAIRHFDVSFSQLEAVRFQGNNDTVLARWIFRDEQSGVVDHIWSIGTSPYGSDVREGVSVGVANEAEATGLSLQHNTTYYVSVLARNGAGLVANVTSEGVTYVATQLNVTLLRTLVNVGFTELLEFEVVDGGDGGDGVLVVRRTDRDFHASVSWEGVGGDIEEICKYVCV